MIRHIKNTPETCRMATNTSTEIGRWENQIRSCPITIENINQSEAIYEPQIPIIQGNTIRSRSEHHKTTPITLLPTPISKHHQNVEISLYLFFVNGISFLYKKSENIDLRPVKACNSRGRYEIISGLNQVNTNEQERGFTII